MELPPYQFLIFGVIKNDDGTVLAIDFAVDALLAPIPDVLIIGDPPLERDVRVFV